MPCWRGRPCQLARPRARAQELAHTPNTIYLLLFNMERLLVDESRADCLAYILGWLDEVVVHAQDAPILLAGSRKDAVPSAARVETRKRRHRVARRGRAGACSPRWLQNANFQ